MSTRTKDVKVIGKGNKVVPVNFPEHLFTAVAWVRKLQDRLGMSKNPYLFAKHGTTNKFRNSRGYFTKQLEALNLSSASRNLGSQGLRRLRASEVMVRKKNTTLSDLTSNI
jgi:hypothetical protein